MSDASTGQVNTNAAEVYDTFFVPALFGEWAHRVADAAGVGPGQQVLDVACGTGVLTRAVAERVGPAGHATGVDINPGMLAVAARKAPGIHWEPAPAEALPFADARFDRVVSQFGLMFFTDRLQALAEMRRVLKPGGRCAVAVWGALETSPGYLRMVQLLERLFGRTVAAALEAPFCLGDPAAVRGLFTEAGFSAVDLQTRTGTARFDSIEAWVHTDVKGWTLADLIDDAQYARLLREANSGLADLTDGDGTVRFDAPAHIVTARKG